MRTMCINIDARTDRWAQASAEFDRMGLTVQRFSAITGDNPMLAFNQSVLKCMDLAKGEDLLLFEDDVVFTAPLPRYAPDNALTVHFGCNIMGQWEMPTAYNEDYALLPNCWQSHATWYSAEAVDLILEGLSPMYLDESNCIFDEWLRRNILPRGRSYVAKPMVAYQRPSFSDIWNTPANYVDCFTDGNKYLNKL